MDKVNLIESLSYHLLTNFNNRSTRTHGSESLAPTLLEFWAYKKNNERLYVQIGADCFFFSELAFDVLPTSDFTKLKFTIL